MPRARADFDEATFLRFFGTLHERQARLCAAERALALGWGGITRLARLTGLSPQTIRTGIAAVRDGAALAAGRIRRPGGGRKKVEVADAGLLPALQAAVEDATAGSPTDVLRWTSKSKATLATALAEQGHPVAPNTVGRLLRAWGYRLQTNRKDKEGRAPPEREAQFQDLHVQARTFLARGQPGRSVDPKKQELVGTFKHAGRTWRPKGDPVRVHVPDCPSMSAGKAIPSGVYDVGQHHGVVHVGTRHDTPDCAVESLRLWWDLEGQERSPHADSLLVFAASGGSNRTQRRVWKRRLQEWADERRRPSTVCHLPPGTSKGNNIEHRLFASSSVPWRGQPLVDYETIVSLLGTTTTTTGLTVTAHLDREAYPTGVKVPKAGMAQLSLHPHPLHPQWNYTLVPRLS